MIRLKNRTRHALFGLLFVSPFIVGFILFFLHPFILSLVFSFSELEIVTGGYELTWVGLGNYDNALFVHDTFVRRFVETTTDLLVSVPAVLMFSLFIAVVLNEKFRGRFLARSVFFLPIVLGSGVVLVFEQGDYLTNLLMGAGAEEGVLLGGVYIRNLIMDLKLPEDMLNYIADAVSRVPDIVSASGIQILILLAGLQSIPSSLYEASSIEGASGWEGFWKITFPLLTPLIPTVILYTIIDTFTSVDNLVVTLIRDTAFGGMGYGTSSAMAWIYFLAIATILLILIGSISRWIVYQE